MLRPPGPNRRLSVAPMIDWTDRHCRYFHRLIAPRTLLYTEMITTGAILHGPAERLLAFDPAEHPVVLQLGGSEPDALAAAARAGEARGYDEIDLNCGCPSDRVQSGRFGACLMNEPGLVAECVAAMREATRLPVTVKSRIGIDDSEELPFLLRFVETVAATGCRTFIVHARKAWLQGLSPKENREIPPLRWEVVHALKAARPDLEIVLNGGVDGTDKALAALARVDGVMVGRAAYQNPWWLGELEDAVLGPAGGRRSREDVLREMAAYAARMAAEGVPLKAVARHLLGLYNGLPGARAFRRRLSEGMVHRDAPPTLLLEAAALVPEPERRAA
ncbi:MAG TPA: tRNA dihydrouridine(20/20a) synthase DusA [Geminicoccaceae bacterium]|nr:tRNA dihydrouridine(20/20a) synthase DusA [Geminicoccaceae bacterium]